MGGTVTARNRLLSAGHSANFERNKIIRETKLQGRALDEDRDDLSKVTDPRRHGRGKRRAQLAPARLLDGDAWNAILGATPTDLPDRDVLVASAQRGRGATRAIANTLGISQKHVRNLQNALLAWARANLDPEDITRHLDDPITQEVVARRPPSRAGRKPKGWADPTQPDHDLLGDPIDPDHLPPKLRAVRKPGPRRPRVRPVCEGQLSLFLSLFDMAA